MIQPFHVWRLDTSKLFCIPFKLWVNHITSHGGNRSRHPKASPSEKYIQCGSWKGRPKTASLVQTTIEKTWVASQRIRLSRNEVRWHEIGWNEWYDRSLITNSHRPTRRNSTIKLRHVGMIISNVFRLPQTVADSIHTWRNWAVESCLVERCEFARRAGAVLTRWMKPVAASQTLRKMVTSWLKRMLLLVLKMLRYCRMSVIDISRIARRNRKPK